MGKALALSGGEIAVQALKDRAGDVDAGVEIDHRAPVELAQEVRVAGLQDRQAIDPLDDLEAALLGDHSAQPDNLRVDLEPFPVARIEVLRPDAKPFLGIEVGRPAGIRLLLALLLYLNVRDPRIVGLIHAIPQIEDARTPPGSR